MSSVILRIFVALWFFIITIPAVSGGTPGGDSDPSEKSQAIAHSIATINADLERKSKQAIIFIGNNGVGKSTLASKTLGEKLVSSYLEETGHVVIISKENAPKFVIKGQELFDDDSQNLIPPIRADLPNEISIWDIPGFSDNEQQRTFISYCLERILANSENAKLVVVTSDASLAGRGALFFDTMKHLTNLINAEIFGTIGRGLLLVITHVPKERTVAHVKTQLEKLTRSLPLGADKNIIDAVISNIALFAKAEFSQNEAENIIGDDILKFILADAFPVNFSILQNKFSPEAKTVCEEICDQSTRKLTDILMTLVDALKNPLLYSRQGNDPISLSKYSFVQSDFQPISKSYHTNEEYFVEINQIRDLLELIEKTGIDSTTIDTAITLIRNIFNILETYVVANGIDYHSQVTAHNLRKKLQQFHQEAYQQMIYAQTFADFSQNREMLQILAEKIISSIRQTKDSLRAMLLKHINAFEPDCEQTGTEYYTKAITLLSEAEQCPLTLKRQSRCFEKIGDFHMDDKEYREAGINYVKALKLHPSNNQCHKSLGQVLYSLECYLSAIKVYQTILDTVELEKCSKILVSNNPKDWQLRASLADAWFKAGNYDKTLKNYSAAASLAPPTDKSSLLEKIATLLSSGREEIVIAYAKKIRGNLALSNEELEEILQKINEKQ